MATRPVGSTPCPITFCTTELAPGGAEKCLTQLATRLDPAKYQVRIVSLKPPPEADRRQLVDRLEAASIPVDYLNVRSNRQALAAIRQLTQLFKSHPPRLAQTFLFHANVVGAAAARRAGIAPVVAGIRVADRRSRLRLRAERYLTRSVARYVCVSESVAQFSRTEAKLPAAKLTVIPNGVDITTYREAVPLDLTTLGVAAGRRVLTYIGRLDPQKGIVSLVRSATTLLSQLPNHDLLLVGEGQQRSHIESLLDELKLRDRVHLIGYRKDVPQILAASDLLVCPSEFEGMPNVVLEAMAAGKPVVATRAEGVVELLGDAAGKQTTEVGDSQAFIRNVVALASDEHLSAELGKTNQHRAAEHFSIDRMVATYDELYQTLISTT